MVPSIEAPRRSERRGRTARGPHARVSFRLSTAFLLLCLVGGGELVAHDGIHIDIDKITAQIAAEPAPRADLYLLRARLLRHHGKPTEALADCDRAAALLSEKDQSWLARAEVPLERGLVLLALERADEALPHLDHVIETAESRYPDAYDARAQIRHAKGELDGALDDADRAFRASPTPDRALRRGSWWEERGLLERAAASYRESIERLGPSRLVQDRWISVEIARGEYESALALIEEELARAAVKTIWLLRRAEVYGAAGNAERRNRELDAALEEANRVLARRRLPVHLVVRAEVHVARGDLDAAEQDVRDALAAVPNYPKARQLLESIGNQRSKTNSSDRPKQEGE